MKRIDSTAKVDSAAEVADGVEIGPFCVVEGDVILGRGVRLHSHVVVRDGTRLGDGCEVYEGTVLGGEPQSKAFDGGESYLIIGDNNVIREHCTLHRALNEGAATRIGEDNLVMAYVHVAHDCVIGNNVVLTSHSGVAGHVTVEDHAFLGALSGVHQFCRVGKLAMLGGYTKVVQDVPPFMIVDGRDSRTAKVVGPNVMGLRRTGVSAESRNALKAAYKLLWRSDLNTTQAIERISDEVPPCEEVLYLVDFVKKGKDGHLGRALDQAR